MADNTVNLEKISGKEEEEKLLISGKETSDHTDRPADNADSTAETLPLKRVNSDSSNSTLLSAECPTEASKEAKFQQIISRNRLKLRSTPAGDVYGNGCCNCKEACCYRLRNDEQCRFWFFLSILTTIPTAVGVTLATLGTLRKKESPAESTAMLYVASVLLGIGSLGMM